MAGRVIRLWHGTTTSRAQAIATEGFRAVPVLDLVIPVAAAHGLAPDELLKAAPGGWLDEDERGQVVCFALTSDRAEMWAQEAPEARWEALRSAWALTRGRTLAPSTRDAECEAFLHRQVSDDPPAVVEVALSPRELERLLSPVSRDQDLLTAETSSPFWLAATEIRLVPPVPASAVVGVQQVPRRVLPDLAAYLLGVAVPEYLAMVTSGRFGAVDGTEAHTRLPWFDTASFPQRVADAHPV